MQLLTVIYLFLSSEGTSQYCRNKADLAPIFFTASTDYSCLQNQFVPNLGSRSANISEKNKQKLKTEYMPQYFWFQTSFLLIEQHFL